MHYVGGRYHAWVSDSGVRSELPSEGKFSITYTAVNPTPSKAVSVGDRDVTVSSSIMTAVNDAGSGLLHNMPGRCNFMTQTNKVAKTIETRGFCNYADRAGDQVFEEFATDGPVTLGSPILFKGKWLGGTGKFEGLSGEFEFVPPPFWSRIPWSKVRARRLAPIRSRKHPWLRNSRCYVVNRAAPSSTHSVQTSAASPR